LRVGERKLCENRNRGKRERGNHADCLSRE
jgi:hypothetical protein